MTRLLIILTIFLYQIASGQANQKLNSLFYNLPLDSSRKDIQNRLKADKNFKEYFGKDTADYTGKFFNTFLGRTLNKGSLNLQPDSIEIELTFGWAGVPVYKRASKGSIMQTLLKVRYYFSSLQTAKAEYENILITARQLSKDTLNVGIGSSDNQTTGEGVQFNFKDKQKSNIEILLATLPQNKFALYTDFTKYDK